MDTPKSILKLDSVKVLKAPNIGVISPPPSSSMGQTLFSLLMPASNDCDNSVDEGPCGPPRLNKSACDNRVPETPSAPSRLNKSASRIGFSDVNVFYFPRTQGHVSVPREGGSTIGMGHQHVHCETRKVDAMEEEEEEEDPHVKRKLFENSVNKSPPMNDVDGEEVKRKLFENSVNKSPPMNDVDEVSLNSTEEIMDSTPSQDVIYRNIIGVCEKDVQKMLSRTPSKSHLFQKQDIDISFAINSDVARSLSSFPIPDLWQNTIGPIGQDLQDSTQWRSSSNSSSPPKASTSTSSPIISPPVVSPNSAQDVSEPDNAGRVPFDFCQTLDKGQVGHYHVSESASAHCQAAFKLPDKKIVLQRQSSKVGELGTRGLTPLNSRARKALLKVSGVTNLDKTEAEEAKLIRESRKQCGCNCVGECLPGKCSCMVGGVECQVESLGHPCKCNVKSCGNPLGRTEFDEAEVKMHYIETLMNLQNLYSITEQERTVKTSKIDFKDDVSIFYFQTQGFLSVPKEGGNSLGMGKVHFLHERHRLDGTSLLERTFSETDPPPVKRTVYTPDISEKNESKMSPFSALYEEQIGTSENPLDESITKYMSGEVDKDDSDEISILKCSICGGVCKRAVMLSCCQAQACRSCAIKKITSTRKCWNESCVKDQLPTSPKLVTTDLVNYDMLRAAVDDYRKSKDLGGENCKLLKQEHNKKKGMTSSKSMPQLKLTEDIKKTEPTESNDTFNSPQKIFPPSKGCLSTSSKTMSSSKSTSCLKRRNPSTNQEPSLPVDMTPVTSVPSSEAEPTFTNSTRAFISSPRLPRNVLKSPVANRSLATSQTLSNLSGPKTSQTPVCAPGPNNQRTLTRSSTTTALSQSTPSIPALTPQQGLPPSQQGLLTYSLDGTPAMPTLTAGGGLRFPNQRGQSRQPLNYSIQANEIPGLSPLKQDAKNLIEILESHTIPHQNPSARTGPPDMSFLAAVKTPQMDNSKPKTMSYSKSTSCLKDTPVMVKAGRSPRSLERTTPKVGSVGTRGLTPLNPRARNVLLKNAGVTAVDKTELEEVRAIRESRKKCGCDCKKDCLPWKCPCALQEISCQVEEDGFPCGCSAESCGNPFGRIEFNEADVKMHYLETMMTIQLLEGKTITEE